MNPAELLFWEIYAAIERKINVKFYYNFIMFYV